MTDEFWKEAITRLFTYGPAAVALVYILRAGHQQVWCWKREVDAETKRADDAEEREVYFRGLFVQQKDAISVLNDTIRELQTQIKALAGAKP